MVVVAVENHCTLDLGRVRYNALPVVVSATELDATNASHQLTVPTGRTSPSAALQTHRSRWDPHTPSRRPKSRSYAHSPPPKYATGRFCVCCHSPTPVAQLSRPYAVATAENHSPGEPGPQIPPELHPPDDRRPPTKLLRLVGRSRNARQVRRSGCRSTQCGAGNECVDQGSSRCRRDTDSWWKWGTQGVSRPGWGRGGAMGRVIVHD